MCQERDPETGQACRPLLNCPQAYLSQPEAGMLRAQRRFFSGAAMAPPGSFCVSLFLRLATSILRTNPQDGFSWGLSCAIALFPLFEQIDARNIETPRSRQIAVAADRCRFLRLAVLCRRCGDLNPEEPIGSKLAKSPRVQENQAQSRDDFRIEIRILASGKLVC